jgi:TetR/AcrR family transcriptional regulator
MAKANASKPRTRIQREKREIILEAALQVFSTHGFRGSTIDQIADAAEMSKPNLLYYFPSKEAIHRPLIRRILKTWLEPLEELNPDGDPIPEIQSYIRRKLEMARDFPRESRLYANEVLQGAPRILDLIEGDLKTLVDRKAKILERWMVEGKLVRTEPRHLLFSIWATTQHYADFDVQTRAILGADHDGDERFQEASRYLDRLFVSGLRPDA